MAKTDPRLTGPRTINDLMLSRSIRHAIFVERLKGHEVGRVLTLIERHYLTKITRTTIDQLSGTLDRGPGGFGPATQARLVRLRRSLVTIGRDMGVGLDQHMRDAMLGVARGETVWVESLIRGALPVSVDYASASATQLRAIATTKPFQGRFLREWTRAVGLNTAQAVGDRVAAGLVQGESIEAIVQSVRGTRAAGYADGVLMQSRRQATAMTRTAVTHWTSAAREISYAENPDVIKGVQFVATLDSRTTDICASLDGQVFNVDEGPRPPMHHQCRSTTTPVLRSWKEMGIDLKEAPPGTRASINGQVSAKITYPEWLRQQPKAFQNEVLGPTKARLFRSGVPIRRFVDANYRPMSVAQILEREGIAG